MPGAQRRNHGATQQGHAEGELTATMTLRRAVIAEHFADDIQRLYRQRAAPGGDDRR